MNKISDEKQVEKHGDQGVSAALPLVTANPVGTSQRKLNRVVHRPEQTLDGASVAPTLLISENHGLGRLGYLVN
jgi:hypothetical protein